MGDDKIVNLSLEKDNDTYFKDLLENKTLTPFSFEMKRLKVNNQNYGDTISFRIPLNSDFIYRCFYEISISNLVISDKIISNMNKNNYDEYILYKDNILSKLQNEINYWDNKFINFSGYSNIQLEVYNEINKVLKINNFTIDFLKNKILTFTRKYTNLNDFRLKIESQILNEIDIIDYVLNFVNSNNLTTNEVKNEIQKNILIKFNNINNYLKYYFSNKIYQQKKYDSKKNQKIFYKWIDNLNHFYFTDYHLLINNLTIDKYSSDLVNIIQSQFLNPEFEPLYNKISGNTDDIYNTTDYTKKIYTPLLFYFCDIQNSNKVLPLCALQNSTVNIKSRINDLSKLIYFTNWEEEYNSKLFVEISRKDHVNFNNIIEKYSFTNYTYESVELILPEYIYKYKFKYINKITLEHHYQGIDADSLLNKYGIDDEQNNKIIGLNEWIFMMNNIKTESSITEETKRKLLDYHYYIDYNYLLNIIPKPNVSLLIETGYFDNIEKYLFSKSNLEYIIDTHQEIIFDLPKDLLFDSLNNIGGIIKSLFLFIQPKLFLNGITKYSKSELNKYDDYKLISGNFIDNLELTLFSEYNLLEYSVNSIYNDYKTSILYSPLPKGVLFKTFSIDPKSSETSGSIEMTTQTGQNISIQLNNNSLINYYGINNPNNLGFQVKIIYTKHNLLTISNGTCDLLFYN